MSNSAGTVTSLRVPGFGEAKKVTFALDTANSTISAAMTRTDEPDYYYHWVSAGAGTAAFKYKLTYDTTNGELDLIAQVETGGTIADSVTVVACWLTSADQDGDSISTDTDD